MLRGLAIVGIVPVNVWQYTSPVRWAPVDWTVAILGQGKFYPILSVLFGIGMGLAMRSGMTHRHLLIRLILLAGLGLMHRTFYPGDVLFLYAITGIVLALPASFLTTIPLAGLAIGLTAGAILGGGEAALIPGSILIGLVLARFGRQPGAAALLLVLTGATAAAALFTGLWLRAPGTAAGAASYGAAGMSGALAYSCLFLALHRTEHRLLRRWLEPFGRLALTHYISGTAVIAAASPVLSQAPGLLTVPALSAVILLGQVLFGRWWLGRHPVGPVEALWRRTAQLTAQRTCRPEGPSASR